MIRIFYILGLTIISAFYIFHLFTNKKTNDINSNEYSTTISIEKNIRNLGKIYKDSIASAEFSILNTGKNPLTIFDIIVDCKCTVTKFDKKPIRPGSFTKVRMTYDSKSLGFFSKKAIIKFNSAEGNYLIAIQGEVI